METKFNMDAFQRELKSAFDEIRSSASTLEPLFRSEELGVILRNNAKMTVGEQNYKPLVKRYAGRKKRIVGAKPILVFSGKTLAGLVSGDAFRYELANGGKKIEVSLTGLAALHQIGAGSLPVRPEVEATEELAEQMADAFADGVIENLKKRL